MCCLFSHIFYFGFDGMGENYIFCRLVSPLLLWCLFPLLCCLFWTSCGVVFCLQMCVSCRKVEFSLGLGILILGLSYPGFFSFFCMKIFYICISPFPLFIPFFLFFSLFFLSSCFVNMLGWFLSFFQIFFLFSLFQLYLLLLFLNSISLYKHWFLNFICFLAIVYKDIKNYLFAYV